LILNFFKINNEFSHCHHVTISFNFIGLHVYATVIVYVTRINLGL